MEIEAAIRTRRSVRNFSAEKVALHDIERIVDAARFAPTASNSQAWKFHVVTNEAYIDQLVMVSSGIWKNPPAVLVISMNREIALHRSGRQALSETIYYDAGIAAYAASLAAFALGIGSCIIASFNKRAVSEILKIEAPLEPMLLLTLGYAAAGVKMPEKRRLEEILDENFV